MKNLLLECVVPVTMLKKLYLEFYFQSSAASLRYTNLKLWSDIQRIAIPLVAEIDNRQINLEIFKLKSSDNKPLIRDFHSLNVPSVARKLYMEQFPYQVQLI